LILIQGSESAEARLETLILNPMDEGPERCCLLADNRINVIGRCDCVAVATGAGVVAMATPNLQLSNLIIFIGNTFNFVKNQQYDNLIFIIHFSNIFSFHLLFSSFSSISSLSSISFISSSASSCSKIELMKFNLYSKYIGIDSIFSFLLRIGPTVLCLVWIVFD